MVGSGGACARTSSLLKCMIVRCVARVHRARPRFILGKFLLTIQVLYGHRMLQEKNERFAEGVLCGTGLRALNTATTSRSSDGGGLT